jgi:hypothetical protein
VPVSCCSKVRGQSGSPRCEVGLYRSSAGGDVVIGCVPRCNESQPCNNCRMISQGRPIDVDFGVQQQREELIRKEKKKGSL